MTRHLVIAGVAAVIIMTAPPAFAQDTTTWPGWTFTPSFGFSETYDDNVTLFGEQDLVTRNNDLIATYTPQAELGFASRRTRLTSGYSGSLLDYRTFSLFNRWDQQAHAGVRRSESARLSWSAHGSVTLRPSTDALEFDGIPFSHTGSTALVGRAGVDYRLTERDQISTSLIRQKVTFDRPDELLPYLRGGESIESITSYHRRVNARTGVAGSYSLRGASTTDEPEDLTFHAVRGAIDRQLSSTWSLSGGAGFDFIPATPISPAQSAPGLSVAIDRSDNSRRFHAGYQRMFLPSFGFGGAVQHQELTVSYFTPLFGSRRFYTEQAFALRDNQPLVEAPGHLPLRTLRISSSLGWAPRPWVRVQGFYSRAQQTTQLVGGDIDRNRIGVVIITSRPVRVQ